MIPVTSVEVEGDEIGVSFGIGMMVAEVGQRVRVVVIVAYRAVGIMLLFLDMIWREERQSRSVRKLPDVFVASKNEQYQAL